MPHLCQHGILLRCRKDRLLRERPAPAAAAERLEQLGPLHRLFVVAPADERAVVRHEDDVRTGLHRGADAGL